MLDPIKKSHQIIAGLKTHNWYKQRSAIQMLTADSANKMTKDNLFVIGRNIYQAACGSSGEAAHFINDFMSSTIGYDLIDDYDGTASR